jgi:hypothetical protein
MINHGIVLSAILLAGVWVAGEVGGVSDLLTYYNDFQEPTQGPSTDELYSSFPTPEDALVDTLQYQQFSDSPYQGIIEGKSKITSTPRENMGKHWDRSFDEKSEQRFPSKKERAQLAAEVQATRRSAIAALGMQPDQFTYKPEGYRMPLGVVEGATSHMGDHPAWSTLNNQGVTAHEAAHRGLFKMMDAGLINHDELSIQNTEPIVQRLMNLRMKGSHNFTGLDVLRDSQRLDAMIEDFEMRAAKYLAQQRPWGPR